MRKTPLSTPSNRGAVTPKKTGHTPRVTPKATPEEVNNQMLEDILASRKSFEGGLDLESHQTLVRIATSKNTTPKEQNSKFTSKLRQPTSVPPSSDLKPALGSSKVYQRKPDEGDAFRRSISHSGASLQTLRFKKPVAQTQLNSLSNSFERGKKAPQNKLGESLRSDRSKKMNTVTSEQLKQELLKVKNRQAQKLGSKAIGSPQKEPSKDTQFDFTRAKTNRMSVRTDRGDLNATLNSAMVKRGTLLQATTPLDKTSNRSRGRSFLISPGSANEKSFQFPTQLKQLDSASPIKQGAEEKILKTKKDRKKVIQHLQKQKTVKRAQTQVSDTILKRAVEDEVSDGGSSDYAAPKSFDAGDEEEDNVFDKILEKRSFASSKGGTASENSDDGIVLKEGQVAHTEGLVVVSAKPLNEPRIYANRLLGRKVNIKDKIILRKQNGKLTKIIKHGEAQNPTQRLGTQTSMSGLPLIPGAARSTVPRGSTMMSRERSNIIKPGRDSINIEEIQRRSEEYRMEHERKMQERREARQRKIKELQRVRLASEALAKQEAYKEEEEMRLKELEQLKAQKLELEEAIRLQEEEEAAQIAAFTESQIEHVVDNLIDLRREDGSLIHSALSGVRDAEGNQLLTLDQRIDLLKEQKRQDEQSIEPPLQFDPLNLNTLPLDDKIRLRKSSGLSDEFQAQQIQKVKDSLGLRHRSNFQELNLSQTNSNNSEKSIGGKSSQEYDNFIRNLKHIDLQESRYSVLNAEEPKEPAADALPSWEEMQKTRKDLVASLKLTIPMVDKYFFSELTPAQIAEEALTTPQKKKRRENLSERLATIQILAMGCKPGKNILKHFDLDEPSEGSSCLEEFAKGNYESLEKDSSELWHQMALIQLGRPVQGKIRHKASLLSTKLLKLITSQSSAAATSVPRATKNSEASELIEAIFAKAMKEDLDSLDVLLPALVGKASSQNFIEIAVLLTKALYVNSRREDRLEKKDFHDLVMGLFDRLYLNLNTAVQVENNKSLHNSSTAYFQHFVGVILYVRALIFSKEANRAFTLLQIEFAKCSSRNYRLRFLFQYAKLVTRHEQVEFYMSALGCLQELIKINSASLKKSSLYYYAWKLETSMGFRSSSRGLFLKETENTASNSTRIYTGDASKKKILDVIASRSEVAQDLIEVQAAILKSKSKKDLKKRAEFSSLKLSQCFAKLASVERSEACLLRAHFYFYVKEKPWPICLKLLEKELDFLQSDEYQKGKVLHKEFEMKAMLFTKKLELLRQVIKRELGADDEVLNKISTTCEAASKLLSSSCHVLRVQTWISLLVEMAKVATEAYLFVCQAQFGDAAKWRRLSTEKISALDEFRRCIAPLDVREVAEAAKQFGGRVKDFRISLDKAIANDVSKPKGFGELLRLEAIEITPQKPPRFQRMAVPRYREVEEIERISLLVRFDTQGRLRSSNVRGHRHSRATSSRFSSRGNSTAREGSHKRGVSRIYESMASAAFSTSNRMDDDVYSEYEVQLDQLVTTKRGPSRGPTGRSSSRRPNGQDLEQLTQSFFLVQSRIDLTKPEEEIDAQLENDRKAAGLALRTDQRLLLNKQLRDAGFTVLYDLKFLYVIAKLKLKMALGLMEQDNSKAAFDYLEESFFSGIEALSVSQCLPIGDPTFTGKVSSLVDEARSLL